MKKLSFFIANLLAIILVSVAGLSFAENAPPAPEVYKILSENDQWRVMEATWQPGQEDNFHYHPGDRVTLFQTDCELRLTNPDGTYKDKSSKAGKAKARTGKPLASHKAKNIGNNVCTIIIVELK